MLDKAWQRLKADPSAQTEYTQWQSLLSIVYGSPIGTEQLFLRHTYLALFARLLAFVVLQRRVPQDSELAGLLTGQTFEQLGLYNFVADDFFSWIDDATASPLLRSLATRLTTSYDLSAIREDLLQELYQELVDPATRHDLGEYYTPDWLAELTLREAGILQALPFQPPDDRLFLLDPACGSGTFLFVAIRLLRESGLCGAELVDFCVHFLAGIDVHPLAVAIARTNFVLALSQDLREYSRDLHVPVYIADSLTVSHRRQRVISVPVDVDDIAQLSGKCGESLPREFSLPATLSEDQLNAAIDALLGFAEPSITDVDAQQGFHSRLLQLGLPRGQYYLWHANLRLMRWLLASPPTDTVWGFVLKNAYRPKLLAARKSALVVGNPPWLAYRYIQRRDYQDKVRRLTLQDYGLLQGSQAHLFTQMELATLFFAFCADRYLADGGTIAFVMPRSVLTGTKQHDVFRQRFVATAALIVDCERVSPLFNVPCCVLVWRKHSSGAHAQGIPLLVLEGKLPERNAPLQRALRILRRWQGSYTLPSTATAKSFYHPKVTPGATIVPRCLWFVRPRAEALVISQQRPPLETDPTVEPRTKPPWKGRRLQGRVEADFLYATLLSDDMLPFGWRRLALVVLPIDATTRHLITAQQAITMGATGLADWLKQAESIWNRHRKSQLDLLGRLNWQNDLTDQSPTGVYKLLYNTSGTYLCACVVDPSDASVQQVHGLPVKGFFGQYTTYLFETLDGDEAHYLCAILNAPCVDAAIKPFQPRGAFGAQSGKGTPSHPALQPTGPAARAASGAQPAVPREGEAERCCDGPGVAEAAHWPAAPADSAAVADRAGAD
ncbi:MAG: N-6 DNA methylase [Candidatus Kapabacteria bacterium]|nr:N-6 DNA methylase [Candidatus Kapabacteria bacterium]MDW8012989.1 N-6 DNA methylase [Bacteroidota bacterium]